MAAAPLSRSSGVSQSSKKTTRMSGRTRAAGPCSRMKPTSRTGSVRFYFNHLFDYPFGGNEVHTMRAMMEFISSDYDGIQPTKSPEEVVAWLKEFHTTLAQRLHDGEAVLDLVPE